MRKLLLITIVGAIAASCSSRSGHLTGTLGRRPYHPEIPMGMVYIPAGSFQMGENDIDVPFLHQSKAKTASVQAYYMDNTEISNNEYRQFVDWVRDSIAHEVILVDQYSATTGGTDKKEWKPEDKAEYMTFEDYYLDETQTPPAYEKFDAKQFDYAEHRYDYSGQTGFFGLNWDREINYADEDMIPILAEMYLPLNERYVRRRELDVRKLNYKYFWIDYREAAKRGRIEIVPNAHDASTPASSPHRELNSGNHPYTEAPIGHDKDLGFINKKGQHNAIRGHEDRSRFIIEEVINVYPDTLCWVRDFTYSFHDPMTNMYFWHPAYDNYPVVGVTWVQAKAFSNWRTQLLNGWLVAMGELFVQDFRLPTEAEWERASRGDLSMSQYPWGGPYIRNEGGCYLANFKPMRGRYFDDGGFHTVKVFSYNPNNFGLYCMAGNVAEWCETAYDEAMYEFSHDLNTEYRYDAMDWDPPSMKRKVIRGGSWKDFGYYLQNGTRNYEYQDTAKSYVGFRNVMTHLGRGGKDFTKEGGEELRSDIQLR